MPSELFLYLKPAASSARESEAGCATVLVSASSFAASSDMVMSGVASTQRTSLAMCGASLPAPGGRPCRAGAADPVFVTRWKTLIAQLGLTPKRRAASRRE
jgi:hypothetical protein